MSTSTLLFSVAAGCGVLFGLLAVYEQMRRGVPFGAVRWTVPVVILVCCCAFGGLAYLLDSGLARTTLYEIDAEGSGAEVPTSIEFDVAVQHPGRAARPARRAHERVRRAEPGAAAGAAARSRRSAAARRDEDARAALRGHPGGVHLDSYSAEFTPVAPGVHRLVVTLDTPDVPVLHVRVGDEQKTDGVRAPGY